MLVERNNQLDGDYADGTTTLTVLTWNATTYTMTVVSASGVSVGDGIGSAIVTAIVGTTITLSGAGGITASTAASGTITVTGTAPHATIAGTAVNASGASAPLAASALATAINATPAISAVISAAWDGNVTVTLTAVLPGAAGNALTTVANSDCNVSGATLAGGVTSTVPCYAAIPVTLEWRTVVASSPADQKSYREIHLHHRLANYYHGQIQIATDLVTTAVNVDVYPGLANNPDLTAPPAYVASQAIFPGHPVRPVKIRASLTNDIGRASYTSVAWYIREAFALWWLNGTSLVEQPVSEKGSR